MRRRSSLALTASVVLLAACQDADPVVAPSGTQPAFSVQQQTDAVFPRRVIVRLTDGADAGVVARRNGIALERSAAGGRFAVLRGAVGNERALVARLGADANVVYAEPDYLRQPTAVDPKLWAFYNPGGLSVAYTRGKNKGVPVTSFLSVDDADQDNVEGYAAGGSPVAIASIDTGVDFGHSEFGVGGAALVAGWDYYDNDADPSDTDDHGTHTTGTMAGRNVGVAGVSGAASNVTVFVYRVCGALGCPTSAIVSAIYDATDDGVVAMNISIGGGAIAQSESDAIVYANANNALVVVSAGNDGTGTVSCPACDPGAISVAASNWQDALTYYSNWGGGLDITAPGGQMYSNTTEASGIYSSVRGGGYGYLQGTSMAAPQVTGTAGIVASITGLTGAALRARLEGSTDDLGAVGYDTQFGHGRLNSYRAVTNTTLNESGPPPGLTASFSYSCSNLTCNFDASGSTGSITTHSWTGQDGMSGSGVTTTHTYSGAGNFSVTLTVGDGTSTDSSSDTVQCTTRGKRVRCN